jgi:hypothetical protein
MSTMCRCARQIPVDTVAIDKPLAVERTTEIIRME